MYVPNRLAIGRRYSVRRTGSQRFRDTLTTVYPKLEGAPEFVRFVVALLSPNQLGTSVDGEPEVIIDAPTIAACMGEARTYTSGNLTGPETTEAFLYAFRDMVLPEFEWTDHVARERARAVPVSHIVEVIDPLVLEAWTREENTEPHELEDRVYLDTGAPFNATNRSRERRRREEAMEGYERHAPVPLSRRLYGLMTDLHPRTFADIPGRLEAAYEAADGLESETARRDARRAIDHIADEPMQWYRFSPYSVRLWGDNPGVATVATPVRRALLTDCYELDLASSQLALASKDWDCPMLYDFLNRGESIWPELVSHVGLDWSDAAKSAVKKGAYGLVFGAGVDRIVADIREEYRKEGGGEVPSGDAFLDHPLMAEVYEARDARLEEIAETGYVVDCFGRRLDRGQMKFGETKKEVRGAKAKRSLLAQEMQARELWLLEPVVRLTEMEYARDRPEWRILCWQHDGFSVRVRRRDDLYLQRIKEAVGYRAEAYGYPTRLETQWVGPNVG